MPFNLSAYVCTRADAIPSLAGEHTRKVFIAEYSTLKKAQEDAEGGKLPYLDTAKTRLVAPFQIIAYDIEEVP